MGVWICQKVQCFPKSVGIVLVFGVCLVFVIALVREDVSPYVPFISETGAYPPESGVFSLFLDVTATIGLMTIILRYMIVEECNNQTSKLLSYMNKSSLIIGIISMLGMIVVAAYPMVSVPVIHEAGAMVLFLGSILYGLVHTAISYRMYPTYNSICICHTRLAFSILSIASFITMTVAGGPARKAWGESWHDHWTGQKIPQDEGFVLLIVCASAEWTMALSFVAYFFTFVKEFSKIHIHLNVRKLVTHFDDQVPTPDPGNERTPLL